MVFSCLSYSVSETLRKRKGSSERAFFLYAFLMSSRITVRPLELHNAG